MRSRQMENPEETNASTHVGQTQAEILINFNKPNCKMARIIFSVPKTFSITHIYDISAREKGVRRSNGGSARIFTVLFRWFNWNVDVKLENLVAVKALFEIQSSRRRCIRGTNLNCIWILASHIARETLLGIWKSEGYCLLTYINGGSISLDCSLALGRTFR